MKFSQSNIDDRINEIRELISINTRLISTDLWYYKNEFGLVGWCRSSFTIIGRGVSIRDNPGTRPALSRISHLSVKMSDSDRV